MKWCALLLCLLAVGAQAHQQSTSYAAWEVQGEFVKVSLRLSRLDLTRVQLHPGQDQYLQEVADFSAAHVLPLLGEDPCALQESRAGDADAGWVRVRLRWHCGAQPANLKLTFNAFFEQAPNHVNLASIQLPDLPVLSAVFSVNRSVWQYEQDAAAQAQGFVAYVLLGLEHILTGWDHLCFLLVLLICARSASELFWLVTGFTLGHSATLGLAVMGYAIPDALAVEWVIAFSILVLAAENVWRDENYRSYWPGLLFLVLIALASLLSVLPPAAGLGMAVFVVCYLLLLRGQGASPRLRMLLTVAFGLFHGFGFAGVLTQMDIAPEQLLISLLGFNLGVELGQVLVLLCVLPLIWLTRSRSPVLLPIANAIAGAAASYWLTMRMLA